MQFDHGADRSPPQDAAERERLNNVHPPDWDNPTPADYYNLVIIGGGTAGQVAAHGAAALGARVALVESNCLGGDCLNVGCVPSKTLLRTARLYSDLRNANRFGGSPPSGVEVNFADVMRHMRGIRDVSDLRYEFQLAMANRAVLTSSCFGCFAIKSCNVALEAVKFFSARCVCASNR